MVIFHIDVGKGQKRWDRHGSIHDWKDFHRESSVAMERFFSRQRVKLSKNGCKFPSVSQISQEKQEHKQLEVDKVNLSPVDST